ncbi:hypothetical protein OG896_07405 [Streptomyces sp. NBC_00669]|uniref:hypothetical protein n=1 Tax=Streptomyces sp. NBC_00669 TaxID=2976011 RepID=UPI002E3534BD|nr:hypothetical protein [Streptomyces sp. NBC_00669]
MAPASGGGFYTIAETAAISEYVLLHVPATGRTAVMVRQPIASAGCDAGKQYPSLRNSCEAQSCVVQSGALVVLMCNLTSTGDGRPQPALAVKAVTS